jgi:hypothetical protein
LADGITYLQRSTPRWTAAFWVIADHTTPGDHRLATELGARLTLGDWVIARELYRSKKADCSEPADASVLDAPFRPEVLADPSLLVQYQGVLPYARHIRFENGGIQWVVFELYCSNPDCNCKEVFLGVAPIPGKVSDARQLVVNEREVAAVVLDYTTGHVTIRRAGRPGQPPGLKFVAALQAAIPDLHRRVRRRHHVLRQLHQRARRDHPARTPAQPVRAPLKVGRNEPCPCGSGEKFGSSGVSG